MSAWDFYDLSKVQSVLKEYQAEKDKKEKLQDTKNLVKDMDVVSLRNKVTDFLNAHPEFCDDFNG